MTMAIVLIPRDPTDLALTYDQDGQRIRAVWSSSSSAQRPVEHAEVWLSVNEGEYSLEARTASNSWTHSAWPGCSYRVRVRLVNSAGFSEYAYSLTVEAAPDKPRAPFDVRASLQDDSLVTLTCSIQHDVSAPVRAVYWERAIDQGPFESLATCAPDDTTATDGGIEAGHRYAYRAMCWNSSGTSARVEAPMVYTTPDSPNAPMVERAADGSAVVSAPGISAWTKWIEVERYLQSDGAWVQLGKHAPVSFPLIDDADGIVAYRARCITPENPDGAVRVSEWSDSSVALPPLGCPLAPTLTSPIAGSSCECGDALWLEWQHNPTDGSVQRKAEIIINGVSCLVDSIAQSFLLPSSIIAELNLQVTWKVRTWGAFGSDDEDDEDAASPWSEESSFVLAGSPTVVISSIEGTIQQSQSSTLAISSWPLTVNASYSDPSGELAACELAVTDVSGRALLVMDMTNLSAVIQSTQWPSSIEGDYYLIVRATSTSGFSASAQCAIHAGEAPAQTVSLRVVPDRERGWATITPVVDKASKGDPIAKIDVYRHVDGAEKKIGSALSDGQSIVDKYAPLNGAYSYVCRSYTQSGAFAQTSAPGSIKTPYSFFYYDGTGIARGRIEPTESVSIKRSSRELVRYQGRTYPVVYDGGGLDETRTVSFVMDDQCEMEAFKQAARTGTPLVYKSMNGEVAHVVVEVTLDYDATHPSLPGSVSLNLTRVDGDAL